MGGFKGQIDCNLFGLGYWWILHFQTKPHVCKINSSTTWSFIATYSNWSCEATYASKMGQRWKNPKLQTNSVFPTTTDPADGPRLVSRCFKSWSRSGCCLLRGWNPLHCLPWKSLRSAVACHCANNRLGADHWNADGLMEHFPVFSSLGSGFPMNSS